MKVAQASIKRNIKPHLRFPTCHISLSNIGPLNISPIDDKQGANPDLQYYLMCKGKNAMAFVLGVAQSELCAKFGVEATATAAAAVAAVVAAEAAVVVVAATAVAAVATAVVVAATAAAVAAAVISSK